MKRSKKQPKRRSITPLMLETKKPPKAKKWVRTCLLFDGVVLWSLFLEFIVRSTTFCFQIGTGTSSRTIMMMICSKRNIGTTTGIRFGVNMRKLRRGLLRIHPFILEALTRLSLDTAVAKTCLMEMRLVYHTIHP